MTNQVATLISIIALIVTIISVAFAIYFGLKSAKRNDCTDIEKKAYEQASINVKLDQIGGDVRDIKYDVTGVKKDFQMLTERVVKVEESAKSAHHRIDGIEEREKVS
jgi:peptidoglycan hydrolase CwlO-like protein